MTWWWVIAAMAWFMTACLVAVAVGRVTRLGRPPYDTED